MKAIEAYYDAISDDEAEQFPYLPFSSRKQTAFVTAIKGLNSLAWLFDRDCATSEDWNRLFELVYNKTFRFKVTMEIEGYSHPVMVMDIVFPKKPNKKFETALATLWFDIDGTEYFDLRISYDNADGNTPVLELFKPYFESLRDIT